MLNKILSKKIKFPLSLRGAKRRSNLSGFSLIELMVAVAILAMATFGIFLAFSTGFQGMADARAVTVATNYAREAMEDIKNMDFDEIPTPEIVSGSVTVNGIIYNRQVIVQVNSNIKKVITTVTWKDRNGKQKTVETDMVVHFIETTAGDATRIMLYADPYSVLVLKTVDEVPVEPAAENKSIITAVIKDAIGNTVTDWDEEINFSLTVSEGSAGLSTDIVLPVDFVDGKAIIIFTAGVDTEEVTITASTEGLTPDSVTIKVYDPGIPVKINLKNFLSVSGKETLFMTPGSESTIEATIVDAAGDTVLISEDKFTMTFTVSVCGTLDNQLYFGPGIVTTVLTSSSTAGTITVTASASTTEFGVISGVINVITGGQIILSASPIEVPNGEQSVITVTTKDVNGVPINYAGTINLSIESIGGGFGILSDNPITFDGSTPSKEVTFTANSDVGTVNITAIDTDSILTGVNVLTLTLKEELTPHHLIVYAMPLSIPAGGSETLITAKAMTEDNVKINSYNGPVTFDTTAGTFSGGTTSTTSTFVDGVATVSLYSSENVETAEITVSSTVSAEPEYIITGSTEVGFYIGPDHIRLSAVPQNISVGGQNCIVTAEIVDYMGTVISSYNGDIAFNISAGWDDTIKFSKATTAFLIQKVKKGIAIVTLISGTVAGTAVIDAYSGDVSGSLNIPVGISLTLAEGTPVYNSSSTENMVSFDINIGGGDFILEEMQVSWEAIGGPPETLNKIEIDPNSTGDTLIYPGTSDPISSGGFIDVTDSALSMTDIHNVKLYFNADADMFEKTLEVIFNPNSGNYPIEFTIPAPTP